VLQDIAALRGRLLCIFHYRESLFIVGMKIWGSSQSKFTQKPVTIFQDDNGASSIGWVKTKLLD